MILFNLKIMLLSMVGLLCAAYAYSVEMKVERAHALGMEYRAACDIGPFSCTRVFTSQYGSASQMLGLPKVSNALLGIFAYLVQMLFSWSPLLSLLLSAQSVVVSVGLLYILVFVLHDVCVVCGTMYIVNLIMLLVSYRWYRHSKTQGCTTTAKSKSA